MFGLGVANFVNGSHNKFWVITGRFPIEIKTKIRYRIICCYLLFILILPHKIMRTIIRHRISVLIPIGNRPNNCMYFGLLVFLKKFTLKRKDEHS